MEVVEEGEEETVCIYNPLPGAVNVVRCSQTLKVSVGQKCRERFMYPQGFSRAENGVRGSCTLKVSVEQKMA